MSSITQAARNAYKSFTDNKKIKDLKTNMAEPTGSSELTTDFGAKISDTDNWYVACFSSGFSRIHRIYALRLKVSDGTTSGPSLLEDHIAREKMHRFDHERIPERVVHARGAGAHGQFRVFDNSAAKWTSAPVLTDPSRSTPIFIRFSTVQGSRGSAVSKCAHMHIPNILQSSSSLMLLSAGYRSRCTWIRDEVLY